MPFYRSLTGDRRNRRRRLVDILVKTLYTHYIYIYACINKSVYLSRCQVYTGRFCYARLVYIPRGKLQYQIDRRLGKIVRMVKSNRCQKQLILFHCHLNYPPCSLRSNDKPRTVCREDCHKLEKKFCRRDVRILGSLWHQSIVCSKLPWTNCQRIFDRGKRLDR